MSKLIILDRDGVINYDSPDYIKNPAEWDAIPGSLEAVARLKQAGWLVAVATNQSGVARGLFDLDTLQQIHAKMLQQVTAHGGAIDFLVYCPHAPHEKCRCRKPKPGMLLDIGAHFDTSLQNVPVIGDSLRDLQAAAAVGARPILVKTGKGLATLGDLSEAGLQKIPVYSDLAAAVDALLQEPGPGA